MVLQTKLEKLYGELQRLGSVVVAFSGGVDSTFLLAAAKKVLGDKVIAVTASSPTFAPYEKDRCQKMAALLDAEHLIMEMNELANLDFIANTKEKCYHCKKERFTALADWAQQQGFAAVIEGSNADDLQDYRPGMRALKETPMVYSPLLMAGLSKNEIREISKQWSLPTWNLPSAACLASRIAYGIPITEERLSQIYQAEQVVKKYCQGQVRVRHHGELARIEVSSADIPTLVQPIVAEDISTNLKKLGFCFVTIDLDGYCTGSLNKTLKME